MKAAESLEPSETAGDAFGDGQPLRSLERGDLWALLGVIGLALIVRALHLQQIAANDPFYTLASVDGQVYDAWARRIVAGVAEPAEVLNLGPLYPHFLSLVYRIAGPSLPAVKAVQVLLGSLTCGLVWGVARELFDRRVAMIAGVCAALYSMLVFYGGTIMIVNLQAPLVLLVLLTTLWALRDPSLSAWIWAGLVLGLAVLARQTVLLFAPIVICWMLWSLRDRLPLARRFVFAAAFALALMAPILPFSARNVLVAGDWVLLNANSGPNLYMGNNARSEGVWRPPSISPMRVDSPAAMKAAFRQAAQQETGREMKASEVSSFWRGKAIDYVAEHPGAWLALELRKLGLFLNAHEVWNNRSIALSREFSWVLRLPLPGFGIVAPLGLLGAGLALRRWRPLLPLYAMFGVYLSAALIFFVLSRYRLPAVPILMIFGAYALTRIIDTVRARQLSRLAAMAATLAALVVLTNLPLREDNLYMAYFNLGNKLRALQEWDRSVDSYQRSLEINAGFVPAHNNLALAFEGAGRKADAIDRWSTVLRLARTLGHAESAARARERLEALRESSGATGAERR
jgi:4-amino-4-deoxy-L-arabinose transferase-like glycosyltransferase